MQCCLAPVNVCAQSDTNFRRAARRVALTPTALGQRIRGLEDQFGVALFYRTTRRVTLTEAGPVVRLSGARLEMTGTDSVTVKTRCFDVQASETARVHADGHLTLTSGLDTRMVAEGEVHVLGTMIWLN